MAPSDNIMYYCFLSFVSVTSILVVRLLIKICTNNHSTVKYPPSPPALPIIGHLHLLSSILPKSFQTLARRYGPLMEISIGFSKFVVVSNAAVAKEILKTHDIDFSSRYEPGPSQYNIYKGCGFINGPDGAYWRFMRKLCMTQLFAGSQLDRFNHIREQEIINLLKSLTKYSREGEPCNLGTELSMLTNNLIMRMTMSKRFSKNPNEAKEMRNLVVEIMDVAAKLSVNEVLGVLKNIDFFGKGKKLSAALRRYDELMEQILKDYEVNEVKSSQNEERDLMDILLESYRDTNDEVKLTRDRIKFFLLELFIASIDTTSAAIQWTMAELISHPQIFKKLREEINSVLGSSSLVKESDVPNLPYLQAIVNESLRLHTPSQLIHRECIKDSMINGFYVKAKSKILINAYAIMRDPDSWNDPDEFIPERFLVNSNGNLGQQHQMKIKGQDFHFLPFGGGRRRCAGATHVYMVMHATVGALTQCFDWKVKDGEKVDINVGVGILGAMAKPLVCYPITHVNPF